MTAVEITAKLTDGKDTSGCAAILAHKTTTAAAIILKLEEYFQNNLAKKEKCENQAEIELCVLAGMGKAWLLDVELEK